MGQEIEAREVSDVSARGRFAGAFLLLLAALPARATPLFLGSRTTVVQSPEPLTTDKVWSVDPGERNPARAVFAIRRDVKLEGFQVIKKQAGQRYGVTADAIQSVVTPFLRAPGSRAYGSNAEFPCSATEAPEGFVTHAGAEHGAAAAAAAWDAEVQSEGVKLGTLLRRLDATSEEQARQDAQLLLDAWLKDTTSLWRPKAARAARTASFEAEIEEALDAGICTKSEDGSLHPTPAAKPRASWAWQDLMEPVPPAPAKPYPLPIARAPARRWDGAFSVRALVDAAGVKKLDGQFLLDSATPVTILSPDWLRSQGVLPPLIEVTGAALERALFTGGEALSSSELSRQGRVTSLSLGGLELPIRNVLLHDTELYAPPENIASCCSGILGLDFLQQYVIQFRPGTPHEVVVWPRENFHPVWTDLENPVWIAASVTDLGSIVSSCEVRSSSSSLGGRGKSLEGVLWDTAASVALEAHAPWQSAGGRPWDIICDQESVAAAVVAETHSESSPFSREKVPAVTVGIPLLARGSFILDLPHGRIWFSKEALATSIRRNQTGLTIAVDYQGEDRVLIAKSLSTRRGSPSAALATAGMKPGSIITEVDGQSSDELDLWEVEQKLAGARGPEVKLTWVSPRGTGGALQATLKIPKLTP